MRLNPKPERGFEESQLSAEQACRMKSYYVDGETKPNAARLPGTKAQKRLLCIASYLASKEL